METIENLVEMAKKASYIEVYRWITPKQYRRGIHTDTIKFVGEYSGDIEELYKIPFNVDGNVECDWDLMTPDEYHDTVEANCEQQEFSEDDKTLVIVLEYTWEDVMKGVVEGDFNEDEVKNKIQALR